MWKKMFLFHVTERQKGTGRDGWRGRWKVESVIENNTYIKRDNVQTKVRKLDRTCRSTPRETTTAHELTGLINMSQNDLFHKKSQEYHSPWPFFFFTQDNNLMKQSKLFFFFFFKFPIHWEKCKFDLLLCLLLMFSERIILWHTCGSPSPLSWTWRK